MAFNLKDILTISLILFSVIDIPGAIPIIIDLRKKSGDIHAGTATLVSGIIMVGFLYLGKSILNIIGLDVNSFAVAGALIIFLIGLEMTLGRDIFKSKPTEGKSTAIVPLAFPIIAGAGTMTTILSLKTSYNEVDILAGIFLNLIPVFLVIRSSEWLEKQLGEAGTGILRKIFGVILIAIAIKIIKKNLGIM